MICGCRGHPYEVIVVDDNSPDGTQDVVKKLQQAYGSDKVVGNAICPVLFTARLYAPGLRGRLLH